MNEVGITKIQAVFRGYKARKNIVLKTQQEFSDVCYYVFQKVLDYTKNSNLCKEDKNVGVGVPAAQGCIGVVFEEILFEKLKAECVPFWHKESIGKILDQKSIHSFYGKDIKNRNLTNKCSTICNPFFGLVTDHEFQLGLKQPEPLNKRPPNQAASLPSAKVYNGSHDKIGIDSVDHNPSTLQKSEYEMPPGRQIEERQSDINKRGYGKTNAEDGKSNMKPCSSSSGTSHLTAAGYLKDCKVSIQTENSDRIFKSQSPSRKHIEFRGLGTFCNSIINEQETICCAHLPSLESDDDGLGSKQSDACSKHNYKRERSIYKSMDISLNLKRLDGSKELKEVEVSGVIDIVDSAKSENISLWQLEAELYRVEQVLADRISYLQTRKES